MTALSTIATTSPSHAARAWAAEKIATLGPDTEIIISRDTPADWSQTAEGYTFLLAPDNSGWLQDNADGIAFVWSAAPGGAECYEPDSRTSWQLALDN